MTTYLLKFDPQALTLEQVPESEAWAEPDCKYIHVESMAVQVPFFRGKGIEYVTWHHPDWTPPPPFKAKRRAWWQRLLGPWPGGVIPPRGNVDIARGYQPKPSGNGEPLPPPREP